MSLIEKTRRRKVEKTKRNGEIIKEEYRIDNKEIRYRIENLKD